MAQTKTKAAKNSWTGIYKRKWESGPAQETRPRLHIAYPGSGHLVNIAENYFENQYQTALATTTNSTNFYPTQNGPQSMGILVQSTVTRATQPTAFILLQTKPEPPQDNTLAISNAPYNQEVEIHNSNEKTGKKVKKERKKGPLVKQWRYTNIFHDEINGAALAAIKTRLAMYYAESDAARKKVKQPQPQEAIQTQTTNEQTQIRTELAPIRPPHQPIRPHTVTIYT